jgi:arylsulfatase A-like enzyme
VIAPGSRVDEPVTSPDFYPTLLAAAGLAPRPEQHVDGRDFGPALRGEDFGRGPIYFHYPHYSNQGGRPSSAIRDGRWKLIHHWETNRSELFDLDTDLGEAADLAAERPKIVAMLQADLLSWVEDGSAVVPPVNPVAEPYDDLAGYFLGGQIAPAPVIDSSRTRTKREAE